MEYLQTFNEHQKRAFKSFQTEKQAERDEKAKEERKKNQPVYNYRSNYGKTFYSKEAGGEWTTESTWIEGKIPSYCDDVVINGVVYLKPEYNYKSCENLRINAGKTLIISSGVNLNIFGNFINNGTLELENGKTIYDKINYTKVSLDGNFTAGDGSVIKKGENASIVAKNGIKVDSSSIPKEKSIVSNLGTLNDKQLKLPPPKVADSEVKLNRDHSQSLLDLFTSIDIDKLAIYGNCTTPLHIYVSDTPKAKSEITKECDYVILPVKNSPKEVSIINNYNCIGKYKKSYFRLYKKYDFNVYATGSERDVTDLVDPEGKKIRSFGYSLTYKKVYKLIGETTPGIHYGKYEIIDDDGNRKAYPKIWFSFPFKLEYTIGTPRRVYSKTEIEKLRNNLLEK